MKNIYTLSIALLLLCCSSCSFKGVNRVNDIVYLKAGEVQNKDEQRLNIFSPKKSDGDHDVLVFIHGGSWDSGEKKTYNFFGNRLARRGVVAVIIDYPLAPKAQVNEMAWASAQSLKWVKENINTYGGNPDQIFVSGHSAGGHLAAVVAVRDAYFDSLGIESPIKGLVLIDAGGLDMYSYLKEYKDTEDGKEYIQAFTSNPNNWREYSPKYHLNSSMPPMLLLVGGKTYPSILEGNKEFYKLVSKQGQSPVYFFQKNKKHVGMITQFIKTWTPAYSQLLQFMQKQRESNMDSPTLSGM